MNSFQRNRVQACVARTIARLKDRAGVAVTYTRDAGKATEQALALTAVEAREQTVLDQPGGKAGRQRSTDREYVFAAADLVFAGAASKPQTGDRITEEIDGEACVFELLAAAGDPGWRHTDQTRQAVRVHAKRVA